MAYSLRSQTTHLSQDHIVDAFDALHLHRSGPASARARNTSMEPGVVTVNGSPGSIQQPLLIDEPCLSAAELKIAHSAVPLCLHPEDVGWGQAFYPDMLCGSDGRAQPVRMSVAGSVLACDIRPVNTTHSMAVIELDLLRLEDIECMVDLLLLANPPDAILPGTLSASRVFHNNTPRLPNTYDARAGLDVQEHMPVHHFLALVPDDIVLVEFVLTRVHHTHGWTVSFQLENIALLFSAPM
ncbi:hypothetical protein OH76DRAFT_1487013 [Lentinus brumalis]|uniref:Uncharacterized protein n=1 Tax=Lentinus brumalis TaxID=2498619 RepID=A0A371CWC9_9APHY|nr:hypothetical protein OH76DRAFT_1487013 [Polyporus brumalis]